MGLVEELINTLLTLKPENGEIRAEKVIIGLGYTCVLTENGYIGLCQTLLGELNVRCCRIGNKAGTLAGSKMRDLVELSKSWDLGERIVGVASINALSAPYIAESKGVKLLKGNLVNYIDLRKGDLVVMVGNMRPFKEPIKEKGCNLIVLERSPHLMDDDTFPDLAAEDVVPKADVLIISGTSIANGTIDRLLKLAKRAREIALTGPSASACPKVLFDNGITVIGCVRVLEPFMVVKVVSEGGGTLALKPYLEQVVLRPSS
ncbi:MAG: DUF364 domain-containing protein [Candidatus Nezhaarchaeales archaeon]